MFPADRGPPAGRPRINTKIWRLFCITKFVPGLLRLISRLLTNVSTQPTTYLLCQSDRWCYLMYASELSVNLLRCCPSHDPAAVWHHQQRWKRVLKYMEVPHSSKSVNTVVDKRRGSLPQSLTLKNWSKMTTKNLIYHILDRTHSSSLLNLAVTLPTMQLDIKLTAL